MTNDYYNIYKKLMIYSMFKKFILIMIVSYNTFWDRYGHLKNNTILKIKLKNRDRIRVGFEIVFDLK